MVVLDSSLEVYNVKRKIGHNIGPFLSKQKSRHGVRKGPELARRRAGHSTRAKTINDGD